MKYTFLLILVLIACTSGVIAENLYDTQEGFSIEIPTGWTVEHDSVNNGIVTFVKVNDDPYDTWIKISWCTVRQERTGRFKSGNYFQYAIRSSIIKPDIYRYAAV